MRQSLFLATLHEILGQLEAHDRTAALVAAQFGVELSPSMKVGVYKSVINEAAKRLENLLQNRIDHD